MDENTHAHAQKKKKKKINTFWIGVEKRENVKSVEETMAMAMAMAQ